MEKILRTCDSHFQARDFTREDDNLLSMEERFAAFMKLMEPYYEAAERLQRIYRVDDIRERKFRDDWGIRVQPLSKSESDG